MSSEFEALQCSCGCELNAENRLECLYRALLFNFNNDLLLGLVDCSKGVNSQLKLITNELPDRVNKRIVKILDELGFGCKVLVLDGAWLFDVNKKGGISYEPVQRMGQNTNV